MWVFYVISLPLTLGMVILTLKYFAGPEVAQATSNRMSKRDRLRPYIDVIDNMLTQAFRQDPSFKPQGGRLGENDMDYDADEKSLATLRRYLRCGREQYYRYKSEYRSYVSEALELEDTIKNYERGSSTGWKYISSFRANRNGKIGSLLDTTGCPYSIGVSGAKITLSMGFELVIVIQITFVKLVFCGFCDPSHEPPNWCT